MNAAVEFERVSGTIFADGAYAPTGADGRREVIDPSCSAVIGGFGETPTAVCDAVLESARTAQQQWNAESALKRAEDLHRVARSIRDRAAMFAELLTRETGKPFKESADEMEWSASALDYYAELGRHSVGSVLGSSVPGQHHYTIKEPMGTAVLIVPANFPILLMMWSAAAALAAGNAVVVKPSEYATLTTLSFMQVFDELPAGLVQCVTGGADVGRYLVSHPDSHVVAFTGSVPSGRAVAKACADTFKPCLIEASGSDAFIVMPSAPIDIAARAATFAAFLNCGQVCTSAEKILVHDEIYDEFVQALLANVAALRIGHGLGHVDIGPMENARERERLEGLIASAVQQGAEVLTGGRRPDLGEPLDSGFFYEPTVLANLTPDMIFFGEEVFGPIAPIYRVSSFDEALRITNSSTLGLGATLYSTDIGEIDRATREIVAGMVWVNAPLLDNDAGPFGGRKLSGIGRQLGAEGMDSFRHTKLVMIDPNVSEQDFWWFPYTDDESWPDSSAGGRAT